MQILLEHGMGRATLTVLCSARRHENIGEIAYKNAVSNSKAP